jgi:hypothetical protein
MAKHGYKQGAMSATDAVHQLQVASTKCDDKWMKAHAASARFFGAREAEVKKALSKCSVRGGVGAAKRKTSTSEIAYYGASAQLAKHLDDARNALDWEGDPDTARWALEDFAAASKGAPVPKELKDEARILRARLRDYKDDDDYRGFGKARQRKKTKKRGLKGSTAEHAARAAELAESIHRTVALAAKETPGMRKTLLRLATQAYEMGKAECSWVRADATVAERDSCRKLREAGHALWDTTKSARARSNRRMREKARRTRYDEPSGVGAARGGCVFVVEKGRKRKVKSDLASAKSAAKRMAGTGEVKIVRACSRGRGSDSGSVVARCTKSSCK